MHMVEIDVPHQLVGEEGGVDGHEKFQFAMMLRLSFVCNPVSARSHAALAVRSCRWGQGQPCTGVT